MWSRAKGPTAVAEDRNKSSNPRIKISQPTSVTIIVSAPPDQTLWPSTIARPAMSHIIPNVKSSGGCE